MKPLVSLSHCLVLVLVACVSCQKVISVKLNNASKKFVIEGNVTDGHGESIVNISQTKSFSDDNTFPGISGATVAISDNGGDPVSLTETSQGQYTSFDLNGIPGHVYTLTVVLDGQTYSARSTMPDPVNLDSISVQDELLFGDSTRTVRAHYRDPATKGNAYHFVQFKNDTQEKSVFVTNDDYTNGRSVSARLMTYDNNSDDDKLYAGDTIAVTMECVDQPVYQYWFGIDGATGESNSATPTNPVSNIEGGALGYFSAHTSQSKAIIAP